MVIFNVLIEFLDLQNLYIDTKTINLALILKKISGICFGGHLVRHFCVTAMSEINLNMLNRFLDLKNLCIATKIMFLTHVLKKVLRTLSLWRPSWTPS